jgi:glutamyl-tRNA reductase
MRVSVLLDANGANTTAAAAVLAAAKHVPLKGATAVVLAGTGPVGQRSARLLASQGAEVRLASRSLDKAVTVARSIGDRVSGAKIMPLECSRAQDTKEALEGAQIVIAAGAAGVELLPPDVRRAANSLQVAIDLNAVPPVGINGIEVTDKAKERDGLICYGAIGVGGTKMKIHRAAIQRLFTANNLVLDAEQVFQIGQELA